MTNTERRGGTAPTLGGRYQLERPIARGGMSQVWRGTDLILGRRVAVKLLDHRKLSDPSFIERFRREAQAAARLHNPHIVAIYDSITESDYSALILEYVRGLNLRQRMDDELLDIPTAVGIAGQVAVALQAAHDAGVIHRDIKPGNILLEHAEPVDVLGPVIPQVRVTDFGIAKAIQSAGHDLTRTGIMLGTAKYLAPEQVISGPVDARTDIFSLGVVLYEMVTGSVPWDVGSDLATAMARLDTAPIPPTYYRPELPPALEAVILQALARDPADRFQHAADLRAALLATNLRPAPPAISLPRIDRQPSFATYRSTRTPGRLIVPAAIGLAAVSLLALLAVRRDSGDHAVTTSAVSIVEVPVPTTDLQPRTVTLTGLTAVAYDHYGDSEENNNLAPFAVDGHADRTKFWRTECYQSAFAEIPKPGVGLIMDAGQSVNLTGLTLLTPQTGWTAQVYTSPSPAAEMATAPLERWGAALTNLTGASTSTQVSFTPIQARSLLVFITSLTGVPPDSCFGGRPNSRHVDIIEATLLGHS